MTTVDSSKQVNGMPTKVYAGMKHIAAIFSITFNKQC
jgi:hypothetical protein